MDNIPFVSRSRIQGSQKRRNGLLCVARLERLVRSLECGEYTLVPVNSSKKSVLSSTTTRSTNSVSSYAMTSSTSYDSTSTLSTIGNFPSYTEKSYELLVTPKTSVTLTSSEYTSPSSKATPISEVVTEPLETEKSAESVDNRAYRIPGYVGNRPTSNVDTAVNWEDTESDNSDATSTNGTRSPSYTMVSAYNSMTSAVTYSSEASISVSGGRKVRFHEEPIVYTISPTKTASSDSNPASSPTWIYYEALPENASSHYPESSSPLLTEKSSLLSVTNSEFLSGQLRDLREEVKKLKEGEKDSVRELYRSLHAQADLLEEHGGKMEDVEFNAMMLEKRVELAEAQIVRLMMEQQLKKKCYCDNE